MPADSETAEAEALTGVQDGVCGAAHDPSRDRDHAFHKRCEHYRHKHLSRRGKVGNAQLATRTLMDVKKVAVLEATTGTFDDGSVPPGDLDRVVVRVTSPNGKRRDERILKASGKGGYFSAPLTGLIHGQALTVDAVISGIDRGKDQVSVDDSVQFRPDLAVDHIDVPQSVVPGLPTSIAATVREMMGDVGAKADCALSSDGAVVDHVNGIWVDAGGVVTCHFSYTFATAGQHALHVAIGNVKPGDYDMTNNGGDATVVVAAPFGFSATAYDTTYGGVDTDEVDDAAGNVLYQQTANWGGTIQSASVSGSWGTPVTFPLTTVLANGTSGGSTWSLVNLSNLAAASSDPNQGTCASGGDSTGYDWITVCSGGSAGATNVNVSEFAGDVTYHSDGVCVQTTSFSDCSNGFTWNNGFDTQFAPRHPYGASLAINLSISDAAGTTLVGASVIPMAAYTSQDDVPRTCEPQPDQTQHCFAHHYLENGVKGSASQ